jgi:c-di-GMP-binding flagellar brake protein YcgR
MSEQRQHTRYPVQVTAEVFLRGETTVAATKDLSSGGAALVLPRKLEEGVTVQLTLFLTQDGIEDPDEEPFEASATVVWGAPRDDGAYIVGLRFDELTTAGKQRLGRFLAAVAE